jgi:DNA-directed RNA polymerase specialized sigma24 family protein
VTRLDSNERLNAAAGGAFATTLWSLVLRAQEGDGSEGGVQAISKLCQVYWYPLYAYVRRSGYSHHDAEDSTQEFFTRLLSEDFLAGVDRKKGRFRSFLLASLKHFLANEWKRANRIKRGGGKLFLSLDDDCAEKRYLAETATNLAPDKLFDRRWAITILERALDKLRVQHAGKTISFEYLKPYLTSDDMPLSQAKVAAKIGTSVAAFKMAVIRARRDYRKLLRDEIAETVATPEQVEEEWEYLIEALS